MPLILQSRKIDSNPSTDGGRPDGNPGRNGASSDTQSLPLVSIGVPAFNGEKTIGAALESLISQDYPNIEIIISDNASTDGTPGLIKDYESENANIRFIRQNENFGMLANFSRVLEEARGEYFMWAAVDDTWHPQFVGALVEALENNPEAVVGMSGTRVFLERKNRITDILFNGARNPDNMSVMGLVRALCSLEKYNYYFYGLHRRSVIKDVLGRLRLGPSCDRALLLALALTGRFCGVEQILYFRTHNAVPAQKKYPSEQWLQIRNRPIFAILVGLKNLIVMMMETRSVSLPRRLFLTAVAAVYFTGLRCLAHFRSMLAQRGRKLRALVNR